MYQYSTKHGIDRTRERRHLKKDKQVIKDLRLALQRGKRAEEFSGLERSYLTNAARGKSYALAYNGFCYIICSDENRCVTMFPLPSWFGKRKKIVHTKETRNYKRVYENYRQKDEKNLQIQNASEELIFAKMESADDDYKSSQNQEAILETDM